MEQPVARLASDFRSGRDCDPLCSDAGKSDAVENDERMKG